MERVGLEICKFQRRRRQTGPWRKERHLGRSENDRSTEAPDHDGFIAVGGDDFLVHAVAWGGNGGHDAGVAFESALLGSDVQGPPLAKKRERFLRRQREKNDRQLKRESFCVRRVWESREMWAE
ncbi:hypothetical protein Ancab_034825, partial [Ancistrocladus abbreviatus]